MVVVVIVSDGDSGGCVGTYRVADGRCRHVIVVVEVARDAVVWGLTEWLTDIIVMSLW